MSAHDVLDDYLTAQDVTFERSGDAWAFALRGERKHSIPVVVAIAERTLTLRSFFMRRPFEDAGEFYRMLLARNMRASRLRFAADADGDVYLVGEMPVDDVDADAIDALLGELLYTCDQMFDAAMATGFASYLERDRAWRAQQREKENSPEHREATQR